TVIKRFNSCTDNYDDIVTYFDEIKSDTWWEFAAKTGDVAFMEWLDDNKSPKYVEIIEKYAIQNKYYGKEIDNFYKNRVGSCDQTSIVTAIKHGNLDGFKWLYFNKFDLLNPRGYNDFGIPSNTYKYTHKFFKETAKKNGHHHILAWLNSEECKAFYSARTPVIGDVIFYGLLCLILAYHVVKCNL